MRELLIRARVIGLSRAEFWDLTFRELIQEFVADRRRMRNEAERDTQLAWQCVRIYVKTMNDKRLPSLDALLAPRNAKAIKTPAQQQVMVAGLIGHLAKLREQGLMGRSKRHG